MQIHARPERRILRAALAGAMRGFRIERRAADDGSGKEISALVGYAAVFNKASEDLGGFVEIIRPGAFADAIAGDADVRALVNHDPDLLIGRQTAKTLRLSEDKTGLRFEIDLPETQAARDVAEQIQRGDMTGCSFSFSVYPDGEERWTFGRKGEPDVREVLKVAKVWDVGPVTFPAYPDTSVAARSRAAARGRRTTKAAGRRGRRPGIARADEILRRAENLARRERIAGIERVLEADARRLYRRRFPRRARAEKYLGAILAAAS